MNDTHQPSRQDRLKAALRDNLRRRKSQARQRAETASEAAVGAEKERLPEAALPSREPD